MPTPNLCSLYPLFIEALAPNPDSAEPKLLSSATGSLYKHDDAIYLITNWHILSGRHTQTKQPLHGSGAIPAQIRVHFPKDGAVTEYLVCIYPLNEDEHTPHWFEHPLGSAVDVAALRITPPESIASGYISEAMSAPGLKPRNDFFTVTQEVWAIGFPLGIRISGLPIWKRATIASEPAFSTAEYPHKILLDTATRQGMSGSPVFAVSNSLARVTFDGTKQEVDMPSVRTLLGIYSGRITGEDELAAQLGIAWGAGCIAEVLAACRLYRADA